MVTSNTQFNIFFTNKIPSQFQSDDGDNVSAKEEEGGASAASDEVVVTESGGDNPATPSC